MGDVSEKLVWEYADLMNNALATHKGKVYLLEAFLGCLTMASRFLAMMDDDKRDELITVVEEEFRNDVEELARRPDAKVGVAKLQ